MRGLAVIIFTLNLLLRVEANRAGSRNSDFCIHTIKNGKFVTEKPCQTVTHDAIISELEAKIRAREEAIKTQPATTQTHASTAEPTTGLITTGTTSTTAKPEEVTHIIVGQKSRISLISLTATSFVNFVQYPVNVTQLVVVDYDPVAKYVYWAGNSVIQRANITDTEAQVVISNVSQECDGIAVDWIARNLYWADKGRGIIEVSRLDGSSRKTLINTDIQYPRAIALDAVAGNMYWSDWGSIPKIEGISLDGNDRRVMVNDSIVWPNGLAIDYDRRFLYWVDSFLDKIEAVKIDGSSRLVLAQFSHHIFGFTYLNHFLYWTDWQNGTIERMPVYNTAVRQNIAQATGMMGIKAYSDTRVSQTNDCAATNGGCSHLCLYTPAGRKCSCPDKLRLSADGKTCVDVGAL